MKSVAACFILVAGISLGVIAHRVQVHNLGITLFKAVGLPWNEAQAEAMKFRTVHDTREVVGDRRRGVALPSGRPRRPGRAGRGTGSGR